MKVSLAWLKEFLNITLSEEALAEVLTLAGLEVEGIDKADGDVIFDISLTPNLGHCMSVVGIAREIGALLNLPVTTPALELKEEGKPINDLISVVVEDGESCPRYACRIVEGIKVGPSPDWLKERLEKSGVRSVNNIVDATNFVMLGLGQPMHAFGLDTIEGEKIVVSSKTSFQEILTLDDKHRDIPKEALLICDANNPIAFAGVMGGHDSAVSEKTTRILLEAAYFNPTVVRRMSKRLGLRTDSSMRFEKGIDPRGVPLALDRAAAVIQKIAGGTVAKGRIDIASQEFPRREVSVRKDRVNAMLGTQLSLNEIITIFKSLGIEIVKEEECVLLVKVPTYRNDLHIEIDLIEEIARIYGLNNIPTRPEKYATTTIPDDPMYLFEKKVREKMLQEGLQEWVTCDLISPEISELCHEKKDELIAVLKPASVDQSILRPSLLPSMLLSAKTNLDHQTDTIFSFEIGRIHFKAKEECVEQPCVGIFLMGDNAPYRFDPKPKPFDFFDLKGICENLLEGINVEGTTFKVTHNPNFHPKQQARINIDNQTVGILGQLHPHLLKQCGITKPIFFAQLNLSSLFSCEKRTVTFRGLSLFPASERDLTLTVNDGVSIEELFHALNTVKSPFLEQITLLDLYKSDQIGKDRKNVTFRFVYRDPKKTIAMETVEKEHAKFTEVVTNKFTR